jgi:hypothetical protein
MGTEVERLAGSTPAIATFEERVVAQHAAERSMFRAIALAIAVALPICVVIWVVIVLLALRDSDQDLAVMLPIGAGIGVFAAGFFGCWAGSIVKSEALAEADHNHRRAQTPH